MRLAGDFLKAWPEIHVLVSLGTIAAMAKRLDVRYPVRAAKSEWHHMVSGDLYLRRTPKASEAGIVVAQLQRSPLSDRERPLRVAPSGLTVVAPDDHPLRIFLVPSLADFSGSCFSLPSIALNQFAF